MYALGGNQQAVGAGFGGMGGYSNNIQGGGGG